MLSGCFIAKTVKNNKYTKGYAPQEEIYRTQGTRHTVFLKISLWGKKIVVIKESPQQTELINSAPPTPRP